VLENGEIIPVGSSTAQKINVRVVAATNVDIVEAVRSGRFREDLYYRLNQISIYLPPLRERKDDIPLLFRKFSSDVAEKYHMPPIVLTDDAKHIMMDYPWYGNVRELKNITEQIAVVETERTITSAILQNYLSYVPTERMPAVIDNAAPAGGAISDRELLLKALSMGQMISEMRQEINDLRQMVGRMAQGTQMQVEQPQVVSPSYLPATVHNGSAHTEEEEFLTPEIIEDESIALEDRERVAIARALEKHHGSRKLAAADLHISERTLYRKLKEYNIE
jgi:DNA-binding NtrC family response regulator